MHYDDLTRLVRAHGKLPSEELAERATDAALTTLAERVPDGVAGQLMARLPDDVAAHLRRPAGSDDAGEESDDFVAQLAERTGLDAPRAAKVARVVFGVVDTETDGVLAGRARTSLPEDLGSLVLTAPRPVRRRPAAAASITSARAGTRRPPVRQAATA